jgi:hypothetical protein
MSDRAERVAKREFWCVYDYGQGGVWRRLLATSREQIQSRYPMLVVFEELPESFSDSVRRSIQSRPVIDIDDDEGDEFLALIRGRQE